MEKPTKNIINRDMAIYKWKSIFRKIELEQSFSEDGPKTLLIIEDDYVIAVSLHWHYEDQCTWQFQVLIKRTADIMHYIDLPEITNIILDEIKRRHVQKVDDIFISSHRFHALTALDILQRESPHWPGYDGVLIPIPAYMLDDELAKDPKQESELSKSKHPYWSQEEDILSEEELRGIFLSINLSKRE